MISNSFDIDFIHGDIHDRSCKKNNLSNVSETETKANLSRMTL